MNWVLLEGIVRAGKGGNELVRAGRERKDWEREGVNLEGKGRPADARGKLR